MAAKKAEQVLVDEWHNILAVHARTHCELDRALHGYGLGASDFEVLDVLAQEVPEGAEAPEAKCSDSPDDAAPAFRVQQIAECVHLSQSALSRLIGRLEKDGLVERGMCPGDRRGVQVRLTDKGRELYAEVLPLQRAVLDRMLSGDAR